MEILPQKLTTVQYYANERNVRLSNKKCLACMNYS